MKGLTLWVLLAQASWSQPVRLALGFNVAVTDIEVTPDGKTLFISSGDATVRKFDAATGLELETLPGCFQFGTRIALSPDGTLLAGCDIMGASGVWTIREGKWLYIVRNPVIYGYTDVQFSPDGKTFALACENDSVFLVDAASGQIIQAMGRKNHWPQCISFSPDGKTLASSGWDGKLRLWDLTKGKQIKVINQKCEYAGLVQYSPDGKWLAYSYGDSAVALCNATTLKIEKLISPEDDYGPEVVMFSPDSRLIMIGDFAAEAKMWSLPDFSYSGSIPRGSGLPLAFSPDSRIVYSNARRSLEARNLSSGKNIWESRPQATYLSNIEFSPSDFTEIYMITDFTCSRWNSNGIAPVPNLQKFSTHESKLSSDGKRLYALTRNDSLVAVDLKSGEIVLSMNLLPAGSEKSRIGRINDFYLSEDEKMVAAVPAFGKVTIFSTETGQEISQLMHEFLPLGNLLFYEGNEILFTASTDQYFQLWSTQTGQLLSAARHEGIWHNQILQTPDKKHLLAFTHEGAVMLMDPLTLEILEKVADATSDFNECRFSPNGKYIAFSLWEGGVQLLDYSERRLLTPLIGLQSAAVSLSFTNDSQFLIAAALNGTGIIWSTESLAPVAMLAPRNADNHRTGWVVTTPDGRFEMDPPDAKLLYETGAQNQVPVNPATDPRNTPGLLRKVLTGTR